MGAKHDCVMIFGPAVDDGCKRYVVQPCLVGIAWFLDGCCYNPRNDSINYMLTTFKINSGGTNVEQMSDHFNHSLTDIRQLIEQNAPKTIKSKL